MRARVAFVGVGIVVLALFLGGCGLLGPMVAPQSEDSEIWIDAGAFSDPQLQPMAAGGVKGAPRFVPGQVIVELRQGRFTDATINSLRARHAVRLRGRINRLRLILVSLPPGADLEAVQATLAAEPDVQSVGLNYVYEFFGTASPTVAPKHITNDLFMPLVQWGLFAIDFHRIPATALPTTAPIIAVVDSGVDYNHPDLGPAKIIRGPDYFDGDMDPMDTIGHGTHVAGIAAALTDNNAGVAGVSGRSRVLAIRVGEWWIPVFAGAAGIAHAADTSGVRVINLSWGGDSPDPFILNAIRYATGRGILVVAAAGNDNTTALMYPAAYPEVLAVGATALTVWGPCGVGGVRKACFSNYGGYVDIAAPGQDILSTVPGGGYALKPGTSMAAPYVAGAAALVWGRWPTLTRDQVSHTLVTTGTTGIAADECELHEFPAGVTHLNVFNAFAARMAMGPAGGALLGLAVDANTGLPLGGATVTARSGAISRAATTRADGTFTITSIPAGSYSVTAARTGYVTTADERTWSVSEGCWEHLPFFALPLNQAADMWTAVVEWRGWEKLEELDAYLWLPGTLPDRQKYMVSFLDRGNVNVHPFARFLRDEPLDMPFRVWWPLFTEALVFRARYPGTYTFAVHDFVGHGNWCLGDAVVRLYRGTTLVGTYLVCGASGGGDWWTVFRITVVGATATVTAVNSLGTGFPGPYGSELFLAGSQRKTAPPDHGIPDREFRHMPRR